MTQVDVPGLAPPAFREVTTPTGQQIQVMGDDEYRFYTVASDQYSAQVTFTAQSDLADLDRILFMELMVNRWSRWMLTGQEADGRVVTNLQQVRKDIQDFSDQIGRAKERLKLDRKSREAEGGSSFFESWTQLADHAREMGVMREEQLGRALSLMQSIFAMIRQFKRSDQEEREKAGWPDEAALVEDILALAPAFDEVDEHFRRHSQRFWIRRP